MPDLSLSPPLRPIIEPSTRAANERVDYFANMFRRRGIPPGPANLPAGVGTSKDIPQKGDAAGEKDRREISFMFESVGNGLWLDARDMRTMFQDTAGEVPVTAPGQSVMLWLDKSGHANHAFQLDPTKAPTFEIDNEGASYLKFDGRDDYLETLPIDFYSIPDLETFTGYAPSARNSEQIVWELGDNADTETLGARLWYQSSRLRASGRVNTTMTAAGTTTGPGARSNVTAILNFDDNALQLRENGATVTDAPGEFYSTGGDSSRPEFRTSPKRVSIGRRFENNRYHFEGGIYGIVMRNYEDPKVRETVEAVIESRMNEPAPARPLPASDFDPQHYGDNGDGDDTSGKRAEDLAFHFTPHDKSTLFQDIGGTRPVTEPGQRVALMLNAAYKKATGEIPRKRPAYQPIGIRQPIYYEDENGTGFLQFDGVDDFMQVDGVTETHEVAFGRQVHGTVGYAFHPEDTARSTLVGLDDDAGDTQGTFEIYHDANQGVRLHGDTDMLTGLSETPVRPNENQATVTYFGIGTPGSTQNVPTVEFYPSASLQPEGTQTGDTGGGELTNARIYIGHDHAGDSAHFKGRLYAMQFLPRRVEDDALTELIRYLRSVAGTANDGDGYDGPTEDLQFKFIPSDKRTLFQDVAGTQPVTAPGQPVALMCNMLYARISERDGVESFIFSDKRAAYQTDPSKQPIYQEDEGGYGYLHFDGVDDFMQVDGVTVTEEMGYAAHGQGTVAYAFNPETLDRATLLGLGSDAPDAPGTFEIALADKHHMGVRGDTGEFAGFSYEAIYPHKTQLSISTFRYAFTYKDRDYPDSFAILPHDADKYSGEATGTTGGGQTANATFYIGHPHGDTSGPFKGRLYFMQYKPRGVSPYGIENLRDEMKLYTGVLFDGDGPQKKFAGLQLTFEPSKKETLYQDIAGTRPVTDPGQRVAMMLNADYAESGNIRPAYQFNIYRRPTYQEDEEGNGYLHFDGIDDFMQVDGIDETDQQLEDTWMGTVGYAFHPESTGRARILTLGDSAGSTPGTFEVYHDDKHRAVVRGDESSMSGYTYNSVKRNETQTGIVTFKIEKPPFGEDQILIYPDASPIPNGRESGKTGGGLLANAPFYIGHDHAANNYHFKGRLFSLVFQPYVMSQEDREVLQTKLEKDSGIWEPDEDEDEDAGGGGGGGGGGGDGDGDGGGDGTAGSGPKEPTDTGFWFDPSDISTLYQDMTGTIPVTASGQRVGLMRDKSGRGNHAYQRISERRPTYKVDDEGRSYIEFNGAYDYLKIDPIEWKGSDALSITLAWERIVSSASSETILEIGKSIQYYPNSARIGHNDTEGLVLQARGDSSTMAHAVYGKLNADDPVALHFDVKISDDICIISENGEPVAVSEQDQGAGNFGNAPVYLGHRNEGDSQHARGKLYSLSLINKREPGGGSDAGDAENKIEISVGPKTPPPPGQIGDRKKQELISMFVAGERGAWWDFTDRKTMFRDRKATLPVNGMNQLVALVLDKSGNENHLYQDDETKRPVFRYDGAGRPFLEFDGVDDIMSTINAEFTHTDAVTIHCSYEKLADEAVPATIVQMSHRPTTSDGTFKLFHDSNSGYGLSLRGRSYFSRAETFNPLNNTVHTLTAQGDISEGLIAVRRNRVEKARGTGAMGPRNLTRDNLHLGGAPDGSAPARMRLYGMLIRDKWSGPADIDVCETYYEKLTEGRPKDDGSDDMIVVTPGAESGAAYPQYGGDPKTRFFQGIDGVWYDPTDISTLWQDIYGTQPVTAVGDPVRRIDDKSGNDNPLLLNNGIYSDYVPTYQIDEDGVGYVHFSSYVHRMRTSYPLKHHLPENSLYFCYEYLYTTSAGNRYPVCQDYGHQPLHRDHSDIGLYINLPVGSYSTSMHPTGNYKGKTIMSFGLNAAHDVGRASRKQEDFDSEYETGLDIGNYTTDQPFPDSHIYVCGHPRMGDSDWTRYYTGQTMRFYGLLSRSAYGSEAEQKEAAFLLGSKAKMYAPIYNMAEQSPLFANGEQGAWYDFTDMATMFQDVEGRQPVTEEGQYVKRVLDKSGNRQDLVLSKRTSNSPPMYKRDPEGHLCLHFYSYRKLANDNFTYGGSDKATFQMAYKTSSDYGDTTQYLLNSDNNVSVHRSTYSGDSLFVRVYAQNPINPPRLPRHSTQLDTPHVVSLRVDMGGDRMDLDLDGFQWFYSEADQGYDFFEDGILHIGGSTSSSSYDSESYIYGIIIREGVSSEEELKIGRNWLQEKNAAILAEYSPRTYSGPDMTSLFFQPDPETGVTAAQGVWLDIQDTATMFSDREGTKPIHGVDGEPIGRIIDKSGNGNHFVAPTDAARPVRRRGLYGPWYLEFDGYDDELHCLNDYSRIPWRRDELTVVTAAQANRTQLVPEGKEDKLDDVSVFLFEHGASTGSGHVHQSWYPFRENVEFINYARSMYSTRGSYAWGPGPRTIHYLSMQRANGPNYSQEVRQSGQPHDTGSGYSSSYYSIRSNFQPVKLCRGFAGNFFGILVVNDIVTYDQRNAIETYFSDVANTPLDGK